MAKINDAAALALYSKTLSYWNFSGYILWKRTAAEWLHKNLPNATQRYVNELMWQHVAAGGKISQVVERRPEYIAYRFHYDLVIPISARRVYLETILLDDDQDDPTIRVVSCHDP